MARGSTLFLPTATAVVVATSQGCSSIPDVTFDDGDGGGARLDAGLEGATLDAEDGGGRGDGDVGRPPCGAGSSCVEGVPPGWSVIAFAEGSLPPCPPGFANGKDLRTIDGAAGAATCGCSCSASTTCALSGSVGVAWGPDATCGTPRAPLSAKAGCSKLNGSASFTVPASSFLKLTPPPAPACNASLSSTIPPVRDARACTPVGPDAFSCPGTAACVPQVGAGYSTCIQRVGVNACPAGFPRQRRGGSSATDTRSCSTCSCLAAPCTVALTVHDSSVCGSPKASAASTGACAPLSNGAAFTARAYEVTAAGGGCAAATPPVESGSLVFADELSICCK